MRTSVSKNGRLLIIDESADEQELVYEGSMYLEFQPTPEEFQIACDRTRFDAGQGIDGDEYLKALPYERTLEAS